MKYYKFIIMRYFVYCFICALLYGCTTENDLEDNSSQNIHIIDINDAKIDRENSGLTIDHFIKLDTPDKALIDQIAKVICYDEKLYILTTIPYNSVYIFSSKGAFLHKFTNGRANNELIYPFDISIDEYNNELLILDNYRIIKRFTPDGRYISQKTLAYPQLYVESIGREGTELFFSPNISFKSQFSGYHMERRGKLAGIYKSLYAGKTYLNSGVLTKLTQDSVLLCPLFSDTIYLYNMQRGKFDPYFVLNSGNRSANRPSRLETFEDLSTYLQAIKQNRWYSGPNHVLLSDGRLFFHYGPTDRWSVFDSHSRTTTIYERMFDELPNCFGKAGQNDNKLIYAYDIVWLQGYYHKHPPVSPIAKEIARACENEEDNPIVVFAKIK